jgi:hypothetical protein
VKNSPILLNIHERTLRYVNAQTDRAEINIIKAKSLSQANQIYKNNAEQEKSCKKFF